MTKYKMTIPNLTNNIKNNLRQLAWLLVCLLPTFSWAQSGKLFNTDNQLSSNLATQVYQDTNGFIWITTRNGLNVYDGYNFSVIKKGNGENGELNTNYINCITQDKLGQIMLGTNKGLLLYNGEYFKNVSLPDEKGNAITTYVNDICRQKNGNVAIGTSGFGLYIMQQDKNGNTTTHVVKGHGDKLKYIKNITEDHHGNLWIITENGKLYRLDTKGKLSSDFAGTNGLFLQDIQEDKQGKLYLASINQGIYQLTPGSTVFTRIEGINLSTIETLYVSRDNRLFIGCDGEGVSVYNPITKTLSSNPFFTTQINLQKSKVQNIIEDAQGNIWFSMLQKGVFMQPQGMNDFGYMGFRLGNKNIIGDNCVTSVFLDNQRNLWVGTDKDGLYKVGFGGNTLLGHYIPNSTILSICQDLYGRIWVATYSNGVGFIDATGNYHRIALDALHNVGTFDIKCDRHGNIWLATMGEGLIKIPQQGEPIIYKVKSHADSNNRVNSIPNDYLVKMAFNKDQSHLYLATSVGLACLDIKSNSWVTAFGGKNLVCKDYYSHCVFVDSKEQVWYGTENGVFVYNLKDIDHPTQYTTAQGLSSNGIASFAEDFMGNIWIGTTSGLNKFKVSNGKITRFFVENGIQSNEFSDGAICSSPAKRIIVVGGTGGFNWFDASKVKQHPWKATVKISGFLIGNKLVTPGTKSGFYTVSEKWVYNNEHFDLSQEDNTFTLQLSTLTYNNVEQIVYAYSINGEEWRYVPVGQNEIAFSHLPAGKYDFQVKAICNGYETPVKEFTIAIHPAWYASIWAKFIYLAALIALFCFYIRYRKRQEEDKLTLQKHIHAEEMGEAKLRFFMNISHEIRTPLTLILTPLLALIKEDKDPHRQGIYDLMRKNSERILHLINQMMDLRKIDKGQMAMHMCETDMVNFVNDEYKLFEQQALAKQISFNFEHDCDSLPVWIDRNNFDKVLMNVLSNAFKFTPAGGKVKISLTHTTHHVHISIKDSGKGIDKDKLETIFQRFYQSPTNPNDRNVGTGIGLDLTRSLVELHYGTIVARNNAESSTQMPTADTKDFKTGSEFLITLPLGKEHLKPEEITEVQADNNDDINDLVTEEDSNATNPHGTEGDNDPTTNNRKASSTKSTIAIVEDDNAILEYLKTQLSTDFKVIAFVNGKEALPEIIKQSPDLVVSDIMMPEMDGNTLCTKLKSNVNTNHIPVILLTAMSREEDQLAGLEMGADAYIVKPFNMDILRRTIINTLSMRRTLRNKFSGQEGQDDKVEKIEMQSPDDQLLQRIMDVINENMGDSDLSVDMIAKKVGISRVHLHRKMKELTNQTPHSFIRNIRLKQAAKLLRESHHNVTDVMYICGFSNAASFSTMFKNLYGCSPRDYMNKQ